MIPGPRTGGSGRAQAVRGERLVVPGGGVRQPVQMVLVPVVPVAVADSPVATIPPMVLFTDAIVEFSVIKASETLR